MLAFSHKILSFVLYFRDEMKWRRWVDEVFVHTLSPNIYRTAAESLQAMEYITKVGNFSNLNYLPRKVLLPGPTNSVSKPIKLVTYYLVVLVSDYQLLIDNNQLLIYNNNLQSFMQNPFLVFSGIIQKYFKNLFTSRRYKKTTFSRAIVSLI